MRLNTPAREVIPQPKLQPNLSKETRRRWQFALLSRAPRKPFSQLSKSHFIQLSKWSDESKPHSVLTNENCMTLTFRMIIRKVERLKLISSLAASICFPALTGRCFRPCSFLSIRGLSQQQCAERGTVLKRPSLYVKLQLQFFV